MTKDPQTGGDCGPFEIGFNTTRRPSPNGERTLQMSLIDESDRSMRDVIDYDFVLGLVLVLALGLP